MRPSSTLISTQSGPRDLHGLRFLKRYMTFVSLICLSRHADLEDLFSEEQDKESIPNLSRCKESLGWRDQAL